MRARAVLVAVALAASVAASVASPARAADEPAEGEERLKQAKALFQEGNNLRRAGDIEGALEFYLRSRALVPSMPNTMNAAFCLQKLGRNDQVLELYEEMLTKFRGELQEQEQQQLSAAMSALRRTLASVDVVGTIGGMVLIDGRPRGTLPLASPVHVLPGEHTIRVIKEGWEPFEARVVTEKGQTIPIDVKLNLLLHAGRLRVEADNLAGADLVLDGAALGTTPWEGTLAPGPHLVSIRKGSVGTGPTLATVVEEQLVVMALHGVPLGPEIRVLAEPRDADMSIDGVHVGKAEWRGRLAIGSHVVEARAEGYLSASVTRSIDATTAIDIVLPLRVDPSHPRWAAARKPRGVVRIALMGGAVLGASLGSGASGACDHGCTGESIVAGEIAGIRAAYILPSGVFAQWSTGYLAMNEHFTRTVADEFPARGASTNVSDTYSLRDALSVSGPFLTTGIGYMHTFSPRLVGHASIDIGSFVARARDGISGSVTGGGRTLAVNVVGSGAPVFNVAFFMLPEVGLTLRVGRLDAMLGVAAAFFPLDGPALPNGEMRVFGAQCQAHPGTADCAPGRNLVAHERAYAHFGVFIPTIGVGERF